MITEDPGLKTTAGRARMRLLRRFEDIFETPMIILGFVWIGLLVLELLNKSSKALETTGVVIWILFILDFLVKFFLASSKLQFLKNNVLTVISLLIPAIRVLRVVRVFRVFRVARGFRLVKVIGSLNRGMNALANTMKRRAFGYILSFTIIVLFTGAAGMFAFEKDINDGFQNYSSSLWWTTMILTTMGSEVWPKSAEGRVLCVIISLYAFAVFGYVTATLATFFIGRDAENKDAEIASAAQIEELRKEISEVKALLNEAIKQKI